MALIKAIANGDHSAPATWDGGVVPGPDDVAAANGFTINIVADWDVGRITAFAEDVGVNNGGRFNVQTNDITFTGIVGPCANLGSSDQTVLSVSNATGVVLNISAINNQGNTSYSKNITMFEACTAIVNLSTASVTVTQTSVVRILSLANVTINGDLDIRAFTLNSYVYGVNAQSAADYEVTVNGNVFGHPEKTTAKSYLHAILAEPYGGSLPGRINVNGNIVQPGGLSVLSLNRAHLTVVGDVTAIDSGTTNIRYPAISISGTGYPLTHSITGNVYAPGYYNPGTISVSGTGTHSLTITGNLYSSTATGASTGLAYNCAVVIDKYTTLSIVGNLYGGFHVSTALSENMLIRRADGWLGDPPITITGNIYVGANMIIVAPGTVEIFGDVLPLPDSYINPAFQSTSASILMRVRVHGTVYGTDFGWGKSATLAKYLIYANVGTSGGLILEVGAIACGPRGSFPIHGSFFHMPEHESGMRMDMVRQVTTQHEAGHSIEFSPDVYETAIGESHGYPLPADVRANVEYAYSSLLGVCAVPSPEHVTRGIPVDNDEGTALLAPEDIAAAIAELGISVGGGGGGGYSFFDFAKHPFNVSGFHTG